jgi:hypothetical protein
MVYKRGAFVAGQLAMVVEAGKDARAMLRCHVYSSEEEMEELLHTVRVAKEFEKLLEEHKKKNGL